MAEKLIKTKIALKQNTYDYWVNGEGKDYIPLYGEVCFCSIDVGEGTQDTQTSPPTVLFKVGTAQKNDDGSWVTGTNKKFSELNWASALAADVFDWAKKSLDEFTAWVAKTPKTVTLTVNSEEKTYTIEEAIKLVRSEIAAGGTAAALSIADQSTTDKIKYVAQQGGVDIVEAIEIDAGTGIDVTPTNGVPVISHQAKPITGNAATPTTDTAIGNTFITEVTIDGLGHVAGVKSKTVTIPDSPSITITDKTNNNDDDTAYVVTNLEESGTLGHTITATYVPVATKTYVDKKAAGAVDYLGTVAAVTGLSTTASKGDFYRATAEIKSGDTILAFAGDLVIAEKDNPSQAIDGTNWTAIHCGDGDIAEVVAGGGLTGGGSTGSVTISHRELPEEGEYISTALKPTHDRIYLVDLVVDEYGHVIRAETEKETVTDTHHQAKLVISSNRNGKEDLASNNVYLNLIENDEVRSTTFIEGAGGTEVSSVLMDTPNGILPSIKINSVDTWREIGFDKQTVEGDKAPHDIAASSKMWFEADSGLAWKVEEKNNIATATIGLDDTITFILDCN